MTNYEKLLFETKNEKQYLMSSPIFTLVEKGKLTLEQYLAFLQEAYHHVKYTVPLLMLAGANMPFEKESFRKDIVEYIDEEYGHHEWILNDIENTGGDKQTVKSSRPNPATQAMISYVKDEIYANPMAFFGMVLVLEGTSVEVATQAAESLKESLNLTNKSFSYLLSHGSLDLEHIDFFESLINRIDNEDDLNSIIRTAKYVYIYYSNMFRSIA